MNTLKNVGNKLFKTTNESLNVELESHKVELALTDDIDKLFKEALNYKNKYKENSDKLIIAVKDSKIAIQNYRDYLNKSKLLIIDLKNKSKELGLELPKEILSKEDIIDKEQELSKNFNPVLMKIQQDIPLF